MRISRIRVTKLFNIDEFNHEITLNESDRVTMIYAPNGFGKTAMLRMLEGLFNGKLTAFREYPFETFEVLMSDGRTLAVTAREPKKKDRKRRGPLTTEVEVTLTGESPYLVGRSTAGSLPASFIEQVIPGAVRVASDLWQLPSGELIDADDLSERLPEYISTGLRGERNPLPEWFSELRQNVPVHLIGTDRLRSPFPTQPTVAGRDKPTNAPTVARYSADLAARIKSVLAEYAELSQTRERSFPTRLIHQTADAALSQDDIKQRLERFEKQREQLAETGLFDPGSMGETLPLSASIEDSKLPILSVFVLDTEEKLKVLEELSSKIALFRSIINNRFQYKHMRVTKDHGFYFETHTGQRLDPTKLSSGEQHEVVMMFELLFRVKPNTLILMDEPEISLHVTWQQQFLGDLLEMARLSQFDVLLATHSPLIINDRWDLTVGLGEK